MPNFRSVILKHQRLVIGIFAHLITVSIKLICVYLLAIMSPGIQTELCVTCSSLVQMFKCLAKPVVVLLREIN